MSADNTRVALITGAGKPLGQTIALHLAKQGYIPVLHIYTTPDESIQNTLSTVRALQPNASFVRADLTGENGVRETVEHTIRVHGRIDLLVHTIGSFFSAPVLDTPLAEYHRMIDTNLTSSLLLAQHCVPYMQNHLRGGRMIFFGAAHAKDATVRKKTLLYNAAKQSLISLVQQLGHDLATTGVAVSCISPHILEGSEHPLHTPSGTQISYETICSTIDFLLHAPRTSINGSHIELGDGWLPTT